MLTFALAVVALLALVAVLNTWKSVARERARAQIHVAQIGARCSEQAPRRYFDTEDRP